MKRIWLYFLIVGKKTCRICRSTQSTRIDILLRENNLILFLTEDELVKSYFCSVAVQLVHMHVENSNLMNFVYLALKGEESATTLGNKLQK